MIACTPSGQTSRWWMPLCLAGPCLEIRPYPLHGMEGFIHIGGLALTRGQHATCKKRHQGLGYLPQSGDTCFWLDCPPCILLLRDAVTD
jgi:hypothetical protein